MDYIFKVVDKCRKARTGQLNTTHGTVITPAFMPVATQASIKTLTTEEVKNIGYQMILTNTYHLYLRPGIDIVKNLGGIHNFMNWGGPILTDSGGFQAFSLKKQNLVNDDGITFKSHIDGSLHFFTPEKVVQFQEQLGVNFMMCLDQCISSNDTLLNIKQAMDRTHLWALRSKAAQSSRNQILFGIIQGGVSKRLREQSVRYITDLEFPGYAIGGLAVGESKAQMDDIVKLVSSMLPTDKPRYLMGVGSPEDLVKSVCAGIDLFDCVLPTRVARNGALFTRLGRTDITLKQFKNSEIPIDKMCSCFSCTNFSPAYLHHLFKAKEILGLRLATMHNLHFYQKLMEEMRTHITANTFGDFAVDFLGNYKPTHEPSRLAQKSIQMSRANHPPSN
jgi:queuine tRNA-ribosyltransferase